MKDKTKKATPNFLIIMSDQHNSGFMGCAGNDVVKTPHLDELAKEGVMFNSTYCGNPICVPSRMTFLTSRECSDINVWSNACRLESGIPTFAHYLRNAGYETTLCGRMHFEGKDQLHGFEKRMVGDVTGALKDDIKDLFEGVIPLVTTGQEADSVKKAAGPGRTTYQKYDTEVTDQCINYLKERDDERPFCMVVGYLLPHCPYVCPKDLYDYYYSKIDVPDVSEQFINNLHPAAKKWMNESEALSITKEEAKKALAAYYGLVTFMDNEIGKITDFLRNSEYYEDTIVIYVSDHGDMAGSRKMWWKSSLYDGSARVPMIWSCPELFEGGRTVDMNTSLLDIGPTLLDYANAGEIVNAKGRSFKKVLEGDEDFKWNDEVYCEDYGHILKSPSRMVKKGPWKLIYYHGYDTHELFNTKDDPKELENLYGKDEYSEIRNELLGKVTQNWPTEDIYERVKIHKQEMKVTNKWTYASETCNSKLYKIPSKCNVFPED